MLLKCVQLISPMFCPCNMSFIDTCFRKIFHVKSKDVVHEWETEFGVFPVADVIDSRKSKFIVKYDLSDNLLCWLCKNLLYCVSQHS